MGKFNYPHFEKENKISVFIAQKNIKDFPKNYFEEDYLDDQKEFNQFSYEFGFGFYDHDFMETNGSKEGNISNVLTLLSECSYSDSFINEATLAYNKINLYESSWIVLMYDFEYKPKKAPRSKSDFMIFLGTFDYKKLE